MSACGSELENLIVHNVLELPHDEEIAKLVSAFPNLKDCFARSHKTY